MHYIVGYYVLFIIMGFFIHFDLQVFYTSNRKYKDYLYRKMLVQEYLKK